MRWSRNDPGGLVDGRLDNVNGNGDGKRLTYYSTASKGSVGFRCWKGQSRIKFEAYAFMGSIETPFVRVYAATARGAKILVLRAAKREFMKIWDRMGGQVSAGLL